MKSKKLSVQIENQKAEIKVALNYFELYVNDKIYASKEVFCFDDFKLLMNTITKDQSVVEKIWEHHLDQELCNKLYQKK